MLPSRHADILSNMRIYLDVTPSEFFAEEEAFDSVSCSGQIEAGLKELSKEDLALIAAMVKRLVRNK